MTTTIENLSSAKQIAKNGRTYIKDCNATVTRRGGYFFAQKHDYVIVRRKTFRAVWNYLYNQ